MKIRHLVTPGLLLISTLALANPSMPYAGQEHRTIKALSAAEIDGLLSGKGLGMAKAAELNHYPGPLHVLQVKDKLDMTAEQLQQTQQLYESMKAQAVDLGKRIVAAEQQLDHMFSSTQITEKKLQQQLARIAELQGQLRYVHLKTHLQQKSVLSAQQIQRYDQLRGYQHHSSHHGH